MNALIVIGFVSIRLSIWFAFKQKETAKDEITQSPHSWCFLFIKESISTTDTLV